MYYSLPEKEIKLYEVGFETDPDDKDILERAAFGKSLSAFLERVQDPLVVAVDGKWGTGKSYFLKKWVGAHTLENDGQATTVYFDAFAHDYFDDPLADLISTISERLQQINNGKYKQVIDELNSATRHLAKSTGTAAMAGLSGLASFLTVGASDVTKEGLKKAREQFQENFQKLCEVFYKPEFDKHKIIENFQNTLRDFTKITPPEPTPHEISKTENSADSDNEPPTYPLIIVIDELDRCRPDYALAILEIIKHFFNVPRVQFVLGVNLESLEHSVKARYGADIDANGYLKRFISLPFELPDTIGSSQDDKPENSVLLRFFETNAKKMGLWDDFLQEVLKEIKCVSKDKPISLRDAGKILSYASMVPSPLHESFGEKVVIAALLVASAYSTEIYKKMLSLNFNEEELLKYYGASVETIRKSEEHNYNPYYDHDKFLRIMIWEYLRSGGLSSSLISVENVKNVSHLFDELYSPSYTKKIPKRLSDEYLNLINILKKDDSNA